MPFITRELDNLPHRLQQLQFIKLNLLSRTRTNVVPDDIVGLSMSVE